MALITCEKACFAYEGRNVIQDLDLSIERGEYLCVIGENGSGKSTLIKGLLGLLAPVRGRVSYGDGLTRSEIGYLPQRTDVQNDFPASVWEVVTSGCRGRSLFLNAGMRRTAQRSIELLGIDGIRNRSFMELSGGQQQRALLARALCATRSLLLLDEPVAGLDPLVTREMYGIISMLHREHQLTIVMISHDIGAALRFSDRILHMSQSGIFLGTPQDYRQSELGRAFAGGIRHD
ncbi:MAG: metal ABC transporter ATP-binding protein [Clostridia bacterium]|nr:metal ABC transporter ATP-binding protein [Clostridia bacterium]MDD6040540.1 metal ABC transporter ATP-binding protein [Clostridia bacterium]